jgi:hypothetical protein
MMDMIPMGTMLEVLRTLVLSTCHISEETADRFGEAIGFDGGPNWLIASHDYGWYLWVPTEDLMKQYVDDEDVPPDVADIFKFCRQHGFNEVKLDRDGDAIPDLPTYEW